MTTTFLDRDEVVQMTGAKQKAVQIKQLAIQGIEFFIGRDGYPRVLRKTIEERLGGNMRKRVEDEPILFGE